MQRLVSNPANRDYLLKAFGEPMYPPMFGIPGAVGFPLGIEVSWDKNLPARKITEKWYPPAAGRFEEYDPADEAWMRPLKLGRFEYVDEGPLFYLIDLSRFRSFLDYGPVLMEPRRVMLLGSV
jgi:hypothetical protein